MGYAKGAFSRTCGRTMAGGERAAEEFRTLALLQNTVHAWGPGRKLRAAELLGQADRALRTIVAAWRDRLAWASWRVFVRINQEKAALHTRMLTVLAHVNRSSSKEALHHWLECSRGRESLRPALAKLASIARLTRLAVGHDALCITARGGHAAMRLRARVLTAGFFDALAEHAAEGGAAGGWAVARRVARAWRARTAHWRQVHKGAARHERVWGAIRTHLFAKGLLQAW
ncbi:hypothetical protein T484DRAFT_1891101 [Baffinella frigidus]|nr:hypothetical protein T484DRAFT_1891101 [Cryptophyta sp. CCMP2293]